MPMSTVRARLLFFFLLFFRMLDFEPACLPACRAEEEQQQQQQQQLCAEPRVCDARIAKQVGKPRHAARLGWKRYSNTVFLAEKAPGLARHETHTKLSCILYVIAPSVPQLSQRASRVESSCRTHDKGATARAQSRKPC